MSFTYTGNPESSSLDVVRDKIGDTVETDFILHDKEINAEINAQPSLLLAAAVCAQKIATRFARNVSAKVGSDSEQSSDLFRHYTDLAAQLRAEAKRASGGVATAQMKAVTQNAIGNETDWVRQVKK